jgi:transcriptional regulator with XRE-family HTH domain
MGPISQNCPHAHRVSPGCFAGNLRFWRLKRKLSIKAAAQNLGVAASTWCQWEFGKRSPSVAWLPLLAKVLEIPGCTFLSANPLDCMECISGGQFTTRQSRIHTA